MKHTSEMSSEKILPDPQLHTPGRPHPRFNRIVLIDDCDLSLFIHETILNEISLSREIQKVLNPGLVLNQLQNSERLSEIPELIFLDLNMKDMSGFSFLDKFHQLSDFVRNKCKIIIVTASENLEDKSKALSSPSVIRYLIKPLDVFHLKDFMYS
jgi:two-component SAPR family response regulator